MQIIQDYKDWKKARHNVLLIVRHMNCFKENLVQERDGRTYSDNTVKENDMLLKCYQRIVKELKAREQKCENVKQKLLDNFRFWKTK